MLKSHNKIIEILSSAYEYFKKETCELYGRTSDILIDLRHIKYSTQKTEGDTEKIIMSLNRIENLLSQEDTETIIHNGKRYRIAESQLTAEAGEKTILDLHCVECDNE